jgi:pimeloyl-ACP methyl ester carboxylesterase
MPFATREGLNLYYEQAGSGEPPLLFVHGWCCDHTFFQPQFDHFGSTHSVTTLDLRGCGQSDTRDDGYDIPSLADDIAWFCGEIGIVRPVVIGHSLGGMIGIDLAARHPDLPAAIIAVDPGAISPTPVALSTYRSLLAQLEAPGGGEARRAYVQNMFRPTDDRDRSRWITDTMCAAPLPAAAAVIRGVITWNGIEALVRCKAPLLVLLAQTGGSNDPARLLAIKPDVQIGVTVGAGHFNQLDAPEQVNPMIDRFLRVSLAETA